jgi:ubiquinol-cytochrome c reductase cytochrome c1 subunit
MRTIMTSLRRAGAAAAIVIGLGLGTAAQAAEEALAPIDRSWSFGGLFGYYDRAAAQRGFQVYREVCAACHGLDYVAFRNFADLGYSEDQVSAIAAQYEITDGPNDQGEMFQRPGRPTDYFPAPFANDAEARLANGGALPPDLSLITKARASGSDYLYSILLGYDDPPADVTGPPGTYYNLYFPGHWLAMPPPLTEGGVTYADGTEATLEQMAADVTVFLTWAAEPNLEARKQSGLKVMLFLIVLTALMFATKRKVWAPVH